MSSHETNFRGRDGEKEKRRNAALKRVLPNVVACFESRKRRILLRFVLAFLRTSSRCFWFSFFLFLFSWWSKIFKSLDCRTYRLKNMWMIFNEILILLYFERIGLVSLFLCHVENKRKSSFDFSKLKKLIYPQFFEYIMIFVK